MAGADAVRLAILADTHMPRGPRHLPERCLELCASSDLILHAGDFTEIAVLEELQAIRPVVAVHGNVDSPELRAALPESLVFEAGGATVAMVHDSGPRRGRLKRLRARFPEADAVVFAHSHLPLHEARDGFQAFNPGSPTERRRAPAHTMGLARAGGGEVSFELVELD
ncbi:MAG: metallophosphoesterase family protein [Solirubrobacterales bacterium]